jgi:multidrug efflux pump subunit AcrB
MERLSREAHVVEIDSSIEADRERQRFITDKHKAALSGVATADINHILAVANRGIIAGYLAVDHESRPLPIQLRMRPEERRSSADFAAMQVKARPGIAQQRSAQGLESAPQPLVAIGELGHFDAGIADKTILHKDLRPVVYVMAELSGRTPAEVIADLHADLGEDNLAARPWQERSFLNPGAGDSWRLPNGVEIDWSGEGEWQITESVFLDMGLGYAFALIAIYGVLRLQTRSAALSLIIMSSIPLTVIGIMPGFWLMNTVVDRTIAEAPDPIFLSVTAMVGMIVLAGIVIRNSLILVEFIGESRQQGMPLNEALIQAGAVRARPVLLTAGTTLIGNLVIALDPVFSGLALAIIFGIVASTVFTLVIVPVLYFLVFENTTDGNAA